MDQVSIFCIEYPVFPIPSIKVVLLFSSKNFGSFIEPVGFLSRLISEVSIKFYFSEGLFSFYCLGYYNQKISLEIKSDSYSFVPFAQICFDYLGIFLSPCEF